MQVRRPTTGEDLVPAEEPQEPPGQLWWADGEDVVQEVMVGTTGDADSTPTTEEAAVTDWSSSSSRARKTTIVYLELLVIVM